MSHDNAHCMGEIGETVCQRRGTCLRYALYEEDKRIKTGTMYCYYVACANESDIATCDMYVEHKPQTNKD